MTAIVELTIPLRTVSALNSRECWQAKARRVRDERSQTLAALSTGQGWQAQRRLRRALQGGRRLVVMLERQSRGVLDDDNLRGAFKGVRDEIALWLGIDDRDPRVRWSYAQQRAKQFAVRIRISQDEVTDG